MSAIIEVSNISKQYRLGQVGTGTISHDVNRWWHRLRGKEDPYLSIGDVNDRTTTSTSEYAWALRDINFTVQQGEVMGIIGRNGAGKSTLLKILSRTTAPSTGKIKIRGRVASLLEVGTGFHPDLTGAENIFLNGAILGMSRSEIKRKFDEIVDFSGVERYIDTPVKRYSSGMYVRLAFAVAAHLEPEILIVDEVLAVGDADFQKKCLGKMKDVSVNDGRTVLFVSHNMIAVSSLCNSGVVLENGRTVRMGPIESCIQAYVGESKKVNQIDIANRKDRKGNGLFKFEGLSFLNANFETQDTFMTGSTLNIQIRYRTLNNQTLKDVHIAAGITNQLEQQLTVVSNEISGELFTELPPFGIINCQIPSLPLVTGIYNLNLFCKVGNDIADWVMNTCSLNIETGDYYKTGKNTDSTQAIFLLDYKFALLPTES